MDKIYKKMIIIFDMDGTLIDSSKDITTSINYVRRKKGMQPLMVGEVVNTINGNGNNLAKKFYDTDQYLSEDRETFEDHYTAQCTKNTKLYEGIFEIIGYIRSNNLLLSVATNAPTYFAKKMLNHLKVASYFTIIKGSEKNIKPKPEPDMILDILDYLDYDETHDPKPVMIGDNQTDIDAAINAGIDAIHAGWGFGKASDTGKSSADQYTMVDSPGDLKNHLVEHYNLNKNNL